MRYPIRKRLLLAFYLCLIGRSAGLDKSPSNSPPHVVPLSLQTHIVQIIPRGSVQIFAAFDFQKNWEAPISQWYGDLTRWGVLRFNYHISDNVAIKISGVVQEILCIHRHPETNVIEISPKTAHDIGDFRIATTACVIPPKKGRPAIGFRIETKLPNTNQEHGLGPNTTDVLLSGLVAHSLGSFLFCLDAGIGILTAPKKINEQNDVFVYGLGFVWNLNRSFLVAGEANGFFSTRRTIPVGTEDRGRARLGCAWVSSQFSLEVFPSYGLTKREGTLGILIGFAWRKPISLATR